MVKRSPKKVHAELNRPDKVFEVAAELFKLLSTPMRLKILSCLRDGEQNVSYLLSTIDTTQPNMSQHLKVLYNAGVLGRRREGVQIIYRIIDERVIDLCRAVCMHVETKAITERFPLAAAGNTLDRNREGADV